MSVADNRSRSLPRTFLDSAWRARGLLMSAALVAVVLASDRYLGVAPWGRILLLLAAAYAGHVGGVTSGLLSAAMGIAATVLVLYWHGHSLAFVHGDAANVLTIPLWAPALGLVTGLAKRRSDSSSALARNSAAQQARDAERLKTADALRQANDSLRESEERFRQIAENVNAVLWMADPTIESMLYVSPAFERIWGRSCQSLYDDPRSFIQSIHPDDLDAALPFFNSPDRHGDIEYRVVRPDQSIRWVKDRVFPMRDDQGRVYRLVGIAEDVTERKLGEQGLRAREEFLRRMFDASPDCIKTIDLQGRLLSMNACGQHLMEVEDFGPLIGRAWTDFWSDAERPNVAAAVDAARAGGVGTFDGFCPTARGTPKFWHVVVSAILDPGGAPERLLAVSRDITDLKNAEAALRDSERFYRTLDEAMPQLLWSLRPDGVCDYGNRRFIEFLGMPLQEIARLGPPAFAHPDDLPRMADNWMRCVATGEPGEVEVRFRRADGHNRWFLNRIAPVKDESGRVLKWVGTSTDIDDLKRAEQALRDANASLTASEQRFAAFMRHLPGIAFMKDASTRCVFVNDTFEIAHGTPAARVVGKSDVELWPPELAERFADTDRQVFATGRPAETVERIPIDGELRHWLVTKFPIPGPDGRVALVGGVAVDVSARIRAEEHLRATNQMLEALINAAPVAVILYDDDARVRVWNPAAERIFGWSAEEVVGGSPPSVPESERDRFRELVAQVLRGGSLHGVELNRLRKDGSQVRISLSAAPFCDAAGKVTGLISIIADVTESNRLREQLLQSQRIESVGRLAGGVAHDFNNLLAVISGYSEALARRLLPADPLLHHVGEINRAAERGASLTRQLLAFSRRQTIEPRQIDLNDVVAGVTPLIRSMLGDSVQFVSRTKPALPAVLADRGQTEQVLVNLALNARDAMPDGGTLTLETSDVGIAEESALKGLSPGRYVRLAVSDTGVGMDAGTQSRMFEPFFTTKDGKGTGLGLSIVHGIVQQRGGSVCVQSRPGAGTTFEVFLPANVAKT